MELRALDQLFDDVIRGWYVTCSISYEDAVENLVPLMDKLESFV